MTLSASSPEGRGAANTPGPARSRLSVTATILLVPLTVVAVRRGPVWWLIAAGLLAAIAFLEAPQLRAPQLPMERSPRWLRFPGLLAGNFRLAYQWTAHWAKSQFTEDKWFWPGAAMCAGLILGLQIAGGAYRAEFDGHSDEAAHFVSALMMFDYAASFPIKHPMQWAARYYLHYPKVGIGHWPPVFYLVEGAWWLVFSPSRWSAMALNACLAWLAAMFLYRIVRSFAAPWLALPAAALMIAAPVVQRSFDLCMADLLCLVWSVVVLSASARLIRNPSEAALRWAGIGVLAALLTKGTAVCLMPVPLVALAATGRWRMILNRRVLPTLVLLGVVAIGWYAGIALWFHQDVARLGGISTALPWPGTMIPLLAGWGVFGLAVLGVVVTILQPNPETVCASALLVSTCLVALAMRAMDEPRHLILVLPALLVLATAALLWLTSYSRFAAIPVLIALALFPFSVFRQKPDGFDALFTQVPHPARMLISGSSAAEGAWIVEVALAETRPSSVVFRASKLLASSDWFGNSYQPKVTTPSQLEETLDSWGVEMVIVQSDAQVYRHQRLVASNMPQNPAWRQCGSAAGLRAYCRTRPFDSPGRDLRIDLRGRMGPLIGE